MGEKIPGKRKKILYVHHGWGIGGAPLSLLYLLQRINHAEFDVKVLFLYESEATELFRKNNINVRVVSKYNKYFGHIEQHWFKWYEFYRYILISYHWIMIAFFYAKKILIDEKPDIVHLNDFVLSSWAYAAKSKGIPVVCHVRDPIAEGYFGIRKYITRKLLDNYVDKFIAISKQNGQKLNLLSKTEVVYNFIDFKYFDRNLNATNRNINIKKVLYMGGSYAPKGFEVVYNSLAILDQNIKIIFAGVYSVKYNFHKLFNKHKYVMELKNLKNVIFKGVVEDVPKLMAECDLVIFPAIKSHFARPIIEAGAMAKPVIASDLDGMSELVEDGVTGLLIKPNDPKLLANKIKYLLENEALADKMGENGYQRAKKLFNADTNAESIFKIYRDFLN